MSKSSFLQLFAVIILLIITACGAGDSSGTSVVEAPNLNYLVTLDDAPDIRIAGPPFEITTDNCGSPVSTFETLTKSRTFNIEVELTLTESIIGEVGGGVPAVAEAKLGAEVEGSLGIQIGTTETVEAKRILETPGSSKSTHTLQWQGVWSKGTISVERADGTRVGEVPFFALTTLSLTQVKVDTVECSQTPTSTPKTEPTATPAPTHPLPTDTPPPELPTPTNTPTPEPTNTPTTPTPTLAPTPGCPSGVRCYEDDFSELDTEVWCERPQEGFTVEGGQFVITATKDITYEIHPCEPLGWNLRFVELTLRIDQASGPPGNAHAGIGASLSGDRYLNFCLDSAGNASLEHGSAGGPLPQTDEIKPLGRTDESHILRIEWTGDEVLFFVDGSQLGTRIASNGYGSWFLLYARAYAGASIVAKFDGIRWGVSSP